jgi:hypothetical protein
MRSSRWFRTNKSPAPPPRPIADCGMRNAECGLIPPLGLFPSPFPSPLPFPLPCVLRMNPRSRSRPSPLRNADWQIDSGPLPFPRPFAFAYPPRPLESTKPGTELGTGSGIRRTGGSPDAPAPALLRSPATPLLRRPAWVKRTRQPAVGGAMFYPRSQLAEPGRYREPARGRAREPTAEAAFRDRPVRRWRRGKHLPTAGSLTLANRLNVV